MAVTLRLLKSVFWFRVRIWKTMHPQKGTKQRAMLGKKAQSLDVGNSQKHAGSIGLFYIHMGVCPTVLTHLDLSLCKQSWGDLISIATSICCSLPLNSFTLLHYSAPEGLMVVQASIRIQKQCLILRVNKALFLRYKVCICLKRGRKQLLAFRALETTCVIWFLCEQARKG